MKVALIGITVCLCLILSSNPSRAENRELPEDLRILHFSPEKGIGFYQHRALRNLGGDFETVDSLKMLVIRVDFTDRNFHPDRDSLYFVDELRHLTEYFSGASLGRFSLDWQLAPGIVSLSEEEGWYGEDGVWDERISGMLMEVVAAVDAEVDFSLFDAFAVIHAGLGEETDQGDSPEQIESGVIDPAEMEEILADTLGLPGVPTNDLVAGNTFYVDNLIVLPEFSSQDNIPWKSLGIYAYQIGIRLGMLPLFDPYYNSTGIGKFGLMSWGIYNLFGSLPSFPCAFHRYLMGWARPSVVTENGFVNIRDINTGGAGDTVLIKVPISPSEYFLIANRLHDADLNGRCDFIDIDGKGAVDSEDTLRGAEFDFYLTSVDNPYHYENIGGEQVKIVETGGGLMIWHIDEKIFIDRLEAGELPNSQVILKGVDLEEADGIQDMDRVGGQLVFGSYGDSYKGGGNTEFSASTNPASTANSGIPTGISITEISTRGEMMSFRIGFDPRMERRQGILRGDLSGMSPIPLEFDMSDGDELLVAVNAGADTGRIYMVEGAGADSWQGEIELLAEVIGLSWAGSPVLADLDGNGHPEIMLGAGGGQIAAFKEDGSPHPIDDDGSPGILQTRGTMVTAPMSAEADGDFSPEVIFLSSDGDSTWIYLLGYSGILQGGFTAGPQVQAAALLEGRPVSHPVRNLSYVDDTLDREGFCFAARTTGKNISLATVDLIPAQGGIEISFRLTGLPAPGFNQDLLLPASGDIDKDGNDEIVFLIPGAGLIYFDQAKLHSFALAEVGFSPPALADLDGDGILETFFRDRENIYLFTGFGVLVSDWPVPVPAAMSAWEDQSTLAQPLAGDIDADGEGELIFNLAGELYALERTGRPVRNWPQRGEGDISVTPALIRGDNGELFLFVLGSWKTIDNPDPSRIEYSGDHTVVSRYHPGVDFRDGGSWP
ncbi:MAG: hypothetical protein JXB45_00460, partial [Candidatus Krumholzibacteriota bacterium]|nr:hypothetical protein [Candidatus Krumholzibacteriota bacterium]